MLKESQRHALGLFVLRVITGTLMLSAHGWPKLVNYSSYRATFSDPLGVGSEISLVLAIFAEFVCGTLLVLGIGTRLVAIPLLTTMLVAAFIVHATDPFQKQEFALLYAAPFLTFIIAGGGAFALGKSMGLLRKWS